MKEVTIKIEDEQYEKIMSFKKVYDHIIEEEGDFDEFIQLVISMGIDTMLKDVIPQDPETLWNTVLSTFKKDPMAFSDYVIGTLNKGEKKKELKEKLHYIG